MASNAACRRTGGLHENVDAAPALCDARGRAERFEREAMTVAVDEGLQLAIDTIRRRGMWNRTLLLYINDK